MTVEKKVNEILNRLEKTKTERFPDLAAEKECRDREERNEKKAQIQEMKKREKEEMKKKKEMDELRYVGAKELVLELVLALKGLHCDFSQGLGCKSDILKKKEERVPYWWRNDVPSSLHV